jgi:hypothetical protein
MDNGRIEAFMAAHYIRDRAMSALILGFFAAAWFGWAQADPPNSWLSGLTVGTILSLIVAIAGASRPPAIGRAHPR